MGTPDAGSPVFQRRTVSFVRRSPRMNRRQERAWDTHRDRFLVEVPRSVGSVSVAPSFRFDAAATFGRVAPLILEIGSGQGEAAIAAAVVHPEHDVLAAEVYLPGLAQTMLRAAKTDVTNLRLIQVDALDFLRVAVEPGSLAGVWLFFPDPWHKTRHHKRRLVSPEFAALVATALCPSSGNLPGAPDPGSAGRSPSGGVLRLATDWPAYAEHMLAVLDAEPRLENLAGPGGTVPRFAGRPPTSFERKALAAGRVVTDLAYRRRA